MNTPPRFLFLDVNNQCNLRCKHCMYWHRKEVELPTHISIEQRSNIISEFAEMNPQGTVVICGGESLMNPDRYYAISMQCKQLGLKCFSVINGTMIQDRASAEKMILDGASEVTLSLNSHLHYIHDSTRGVSGSFDMVVKSMKLLLSARKRLKVNKPIYAMAVICEQNYRDLDEMYDFVLNKIGADKLKLNFLQPTFSPLSNMVDNDKFYENNIIRDYEELCSIIKSCGEKYNLNLNPKWLEVVRIYHRSVNGNNDALKGWQGEGTEVPICNSYDRNIMVDMNGVARLCFALPYEGTQISYYGDLREFWYGSDAEREQMKTCKQYCGISHSVRKESSTLK